MSDERASQPTRRADGRMTRTGAQPVQGRTTSMVPSRAGAAVNSGSGVSLPSNSRAQTPQPGAGRMMFRPVMVQRRRAPSSSAQQPSQGSVKEEPKEHQFGGQRRGSLRASQPRPRPPTEMVATGPFALGSAAVSDRQRERERLSASISVTPRPVQTTTPAVADSNASSALRSTDTSIDIEHVQDLDQMAPQSLLRVPALIKSESSLIKTNEDELQDDVNEAQALDLSDNEDDTQEDPKTSGFATSVQDGITDGQLFLFQFPQTFPTFSRQGGAAPAPVDMTNDDVQVSDVKAEHGAETMPSAEGQIGRLDVYADGRVILNMGGIPFDVAGGSETSFLQQVMLLDPARQVAQCLGDIHSKLVVTPDLDYFMHYRN